MKKIIFFTLALFILAFCSMSCKKENPTNRQLFTGEWVFDSVSLGFGSPVVDFDNPEKDLGLNIQNGEFSGMWSCPFVLVDEHFFTTNFEGLDMENVHYSFDGETTMVWTFFDGSRFIFLKK